MAERVLLWFRRDLRLEDNTAFRHALESGSEVVPVFILDRRILDRDTIGEPRRRFLRSALEALDGELRQRGSGLTVSESDDAPRELNRLAQETEAWALYYNRDHTPYAVRRDTRATRGMQMTGRVTMSFDDMLLVPPYRTMDEEGGVPSTFEDFLPRWLAALDLEPSAPAEPAGRLTSPEAISGDAEGLLATLAAGPSTTVGATPAHAQSRLAEFVREDLGDYRQARQLATASTSRLSAALKFGTLSIRQVARAVLAFGAQHPDNQASAEDFVSRLAWRDFAAHRLFADPGLLAPPTGPPERRLGHGEVPAEARLAAWQEGRTGVPIIDAGMRQLRGEGFLPDPVRGLVASFLAHQLGCDLTDGENHFRRHLADADVAINRMGWRLASDRAIDPVLEGLRIDPRGEYIRRWLPELEAVPDEHVHAPWEMPGPVEIDYPQPIVPVSAARGPNREEE